MSGYTKKELVSEIINKAIDIRLFYKEPFVNYRGQTTDGEGLYTEIVAEWVIKHIDVFQNIAPLKRQGPYFTAGHDGIPARLNSNREEELIAKKIFRQGELPIVGRILDYQTPLKNRQKDKAGKIDLLAYDGRILRILELKEPKSTETMLRCVLEGYTYLKTIDTEKLIEDFNRYAGANIPKETAVKAGPLVFRGGSQDLEMQEPRPRPMLRELIKRLDCKPLYISIINDVYIVTEN